MAKRWAENGAQVTVLTCFPNHPNGVIPREYRGMRRCIEKREGVKVVRTFVYAAPNRGLVKRVLNYLSFMISSVLLGFRHIGKPDVLIATSPQFFVAVAGYVISRLKRCKFVFEVRDVWPEEIVAVGALNNKAAIKLLEAIEMYLYRRADMIVAVARGTIELLTKRGVPESKIALIPNGVDIDRFCNASNGLGLRRRLGMQEKFIVGYIGTHGMAHRLDTVLECAARLKHLADIQFLFVGDGAEKPNLLKKAQTLRLDNTFFHEQVDSAKVVEFYRACDICLVPLRKAKLFTKNIPSKIYEIMACQRPIIICTNGESRRVVEEAAAGIACRPEDPDELTEKILHLYRNKDERLRLGRSGFSYVLANSSRQRLADEYMKLLGQMVSDPTPSFEAKRKQDSTENIDEAEEMKRVID